MRRLATWSKVLLSIGAALLLARVDLAISQDDAALRVKADAYDAGSWNGILFVVHDETGFQVRIGTRTEGGDYLDGDHFNRFLTGRDDLFDEAAKKKKTSHPSRSLARFYESVTEVRPHASNGPYCRFKGNPVLANDPIQTEITELNQGCC